MVLRELSRCSRRPPPPELVQLSHSWLRRWPPRILLVMCLALVCLLPPSSAGSTANPIPAENQLPGSESWRLGQPGFQQSVDTVGQIQGYASATSVARGESINFFVTVSPRQQFVVDFYRMGWYGG